MIRLRLRLLLLPIVTGGSIAAAPPVAKLPDRLLRCTIARVTNFDPQGFQTPRDLTYEGHHPFTVFLPAIPVRTSPPPDPVDPPEPVDPATRIVADPDGITAGTPPGFDRVVDYWPDRVEMTRTIQDPLVSLVIISAIDPARHVADISVTRATDLTALDTQHLYQGRCTVTEGAAARSAR